MAYTNFSIQHIGHIEAHAYLDLQSTPITISFESSVSADVNGFKARSEVCLHLENRALAAALVEAINRVVAEHTGAKQPEEIAA